MQPDLTETKESEENQSKIPSLVYKVAIYLLPLWWFWFVVAAVFTRVAHFINIKLGTNLICVVGVSVPILIFVYLWATNSWFYKRAWMIGIIWLVIPLIISQLGITQGAIIERFGDAWAIEYP